MLNKTVEEYLNRQVEREFYSSNLYLAMASWAETRGFEGTAKWLYAQADEERLHTLKFISFINERGGFAAIPEVKKPPVEWLTVKKVFDEVITHEEFITHSINEIVGVCIEQKDYTTHSWIQWFVNEQIQEEKSARAIVDKLNMLNENNMYIFDKDIFAMRAAEAKA